MKHCASAHRVAAVTRLASVRVTTVRCGQAVVEMVSRDRRRDERGVVAVWTVLVASGVVVILLGLVHDGGTAVNRRIEAHRAAEQAARAAADEMRGVRDGVESINRATAVQRANQVLTQSGWTGSVAIRGLEVDVTVAGKSENVFLGVIGFRSFPINETGTATAIDRPDD